MLGLIIFVMFSHHSDQMSQRSEVSRVTQLVTRSPIELLWTAKKVGRYVFFGQVMSSHHSDQMSQRSQVSRIAPLGYSLRLVVR